MSKCLAAILTKANCSHLPSPTQVQPALENGPKFGSAWDCIGFTTAPIWSGLFVTSFMAVGLALAICAILDIKPPNRFESRTGKQLTFTVQE
ncbi:AAEL002545-PA [Aedes aegypti]|uniref:AAEL002545-PA n=1 Tax=Aedes aegypti TaxID=7159 RepID=Q17HW8_AEDAE|nr:AAEL002545-PA [Aedes aegypti]